MRLGKILFFVAVGLIVLLIGIRLNFGSGDQLPDLTGSPLFEAEALEEVVALDYPPGNIAVSVDGRVFFTLHPDGSPPNQVLELTATGPQPFPSKRYQSPSDEVPYFQSILSIRIDRQNRLWVLDFAEFGRGTPRLLAFNLAAAGGEPVHVFEFPDEVAGFGSMLNDFQVSPDGRWIYIAETSPIFHRPALIVYEVEKQRARRALHRHKSVMPQNYVIHAPGRPMIIFGLVNMRIGVDSIALDRSGEWLYYGAVTGGRMYRVRAADLRNEALGADELAARVESFADKTLSDGITSDDAGNLYLSDMEHSAVVRLSADGNLTTLLKDNRLRWPDGFSFGPDGMALRYGQFSAPRVVRVEVAHAGERAVSYFSVSPGRNGISRSLALWATNVVGVVREAKTDSS